MRVAALSTNIGWAPGAIVMNATDYAQASASEDASAYNVLLTPASRRSGRAARSNGRSGRARASRSETAATARRPAEHPQPPGPCRLTQIATLILIVAVLAMAAAMAKMVWQRRPRLAKLKLEGLPRRELWRTILLESVLLLGVGCTSGAVFGLYGQQLLDRALANVIGFPVVYSFGALVALTSLAARDRRLGR